MKTTFPGYCVIVGLGLALLACTGSQPSIEAVHVQPAGATDAVGGDADDPAIWVHPTDPSQSLILGTIKEAAPRGALAVFDLQGHTLQTIDNLDRPNNVDVERGLILNGVATDIALVTERNQTRLRAFAIDPETRRLTDVSSPLGLKVFEGEEGERAAPMGIAIYRRPSDHALFAVVGRKEGPRQGYLWQYALSDDGQGRVIATKVREFGSFSGRGEIEAIAVDDELGYVYYADENNGIHKWHADPDHPDAARKLAVFGTNGFRGDREGIAIYAGDNGTGYILCTDQVTGDAAYRVYRREGSPTDPDDHSELVAVIHGGADETDGIEATSLPLGDAFPDGIMVAMNSGPRNFLIFDWRDIATAVAND